MPKQKKRKEENEKSRFNIKNLILGIIIAFVFLFFSVHGSKLAYTEPKYEDFCNYSYYQYPEKTRIINCTEKPEVVIKTQDCYNKRGNAIPVYDENGCQKNITCDYCQKEYDKADEKYSRGLFLISIIFGVFVIAISALLVSVNSVSSGLMFGSLMFIIYGSARYWRFMNDWLRFIILGIALVVLIYVGYKIGKR